MCPSSFGRRTSGGSCVVHQVGWQTTAQDLGSSPGTSRCPSQFGSLLGVLGGVGGGQLRSGALPPARQTTRLCIAVVSLDAVAPVLHGVDHPLRFLGHRHLGASALRACQQLIAHAAPPFPAWADMAASMAGSASTHSVRTGVSDRFAAHSRRTL